MLLPISNNPLRRSLDEWFDGMNITPMTMAEFDDSALLKAFGEAALGVYPAPSAIAEEISSMYHSVELGAVEGIKESYFAISPERKLKHPAVLQITEMARSRLFG
jgi:LysR family transcriptional activator of nhaA